MMRIGKGTHYEGPILGDNRSGGGLFSGVELSAVGAVRSPYNCYFDNFKHYTDLTDWESNGWAETRVGVAAVEAIVYDPTQQLIVIDAGTVADEGTNNQFNAAHSVGAQHASLLGAQVSTATLMDARELIWATRIAFLVGNGTTFDSKALLGWYGTDASIMDPATGAMATVVGGGIGFHINGDTGTRTINAVMQGDGGSVTSTSTGVSIGTLGTTFATGGFIDLGFRARWIDASAGTGVVDFYVNGVKRVSYNGATVPLPMQATATYSNTIELVNGPAAADQVDMGVDFIFNAITRPGLSYPYSTGLNL